MNITVKNIQIAFYSRSATELIATQSASLALYVHARIVGLSPLHLLFVSLTVLICRSSLCCAFHRCIHWSMFARRFNCWCRSVNRLHVYRCTRWLLQHAAILSAAFIAAFLSVCLSVTRRYYVRRNGRIGWCRLHHWRV